MFITEVIVDLIGIIYCAENVNKYATVQCIFIALIISVCYITEHCQAVAFSRWPDGIFSRDAYERMGARFSMQCSEPAVAKCIISAELFNDDAVLVYVLCL